MGIVREWPQTQHDTEPVFAPYVVVQYKYFIEYTSAWFLRAA